MNKFIKQNFFYKKAGERMFAGADQLLFQRAGELRKQATHAEEILWNYSRTKPLGFKFRRQHAYLNCILDFYCHALRLVIEISRSIHNEEEIKRNDKARQEQLKRHGLKVVRLSNNDIENTPDAVIIKIENYLTLKTKPNEAGKQ